MTAKWDSHLSLHEWLHQKVTCTARRAWRSRLLVLLQAKSKVQEAIDVDGGERVQSAVEAGLLEASRRQVSQEGASASSEEETSQQQQQQESASSSAPAQAELQTTSDEQLQAAIQQLRVQKEDNPGQGHTEGSNGSEARESSAVTAESSNSKQN